MNRRRGFFMLIGIVPWAQAAGQGPDRCAAALRQEGTVEPQGTLFVRCRSLDRNFFRPGIGSREKNATFASLLINRPYNYMSNYINTEKKQELFQNYGKAANDTGSAESQIALFSYRIAHLTEHLKQHKHDYNTQRALLKLVGKRRSMLDYLVKTDIERYRAIVKALGLRK